MECYNNCRVMEDEFVWCENCVNELNDKITSLQKEKEALERDNQILDERILKLEHYIKGEEE